MLFTEDILFVHVPKMAGMSITRFLLNNLRGDLHMYLPASAFDHAVQTLAFDDVRARLELIEGARHEDMHDAREKLALRGIGLSSFKLVIAAIRDPYDLEVSHCEHMCARHAKNAVRISQAQQECLERRDFAQFVEIFPFFKRSADEFERFWTRDGVAPDNLRRIRFENLGPELHDAVAPYSLARYQLPHVNRSRREVPLEGYLTPAIEAAIYRKYAYLFDFYERWRA
ncbi:hypothetical protein EDC22_104117 [Tepidamorphus gemmatus]|uniref:Sulfotransferase family protein n=1 Tax=Tepidamorphus gemmatus TaxID=747076 RepID=A0A4R3MCQ3_9HYPH|nr:hypothetical protein [Tepidamorphus gemmatus]TCT11360.1 hypothetical protein EDC22_104117 [Tepidamorphus gemmatus]